MHIQKPSYPNRPLRTTAALVTLLAFTFMFPHVGTSSLWVEVQPRSVEVDKAGVWSIHFIDAETGWARTLDSILRTADGGQSWRRHELLHDFPGYKWDFSSPTTGWGLTEWRPQDSPKLLEDFEFNQTTDGGLTWQPKRGKVTELVLIGEEKPNPNRPLAQNIRRTQEEIYFFDDQFGWIVGPTGDWVWRRDWLGDPIDKKLAGNYLCSTRDGGESWTCQIHIYPTRKSGHFNVDEYYRRPENVDFPNPQVGWIAPATGWMYHTINGGADWEVVGHPLPNVEPVLPRQTFLNQIKFVDESRGWARTTEGAWFTADAGRTWKRKFRGQHGFLYANKDGVWLPGYTWSPTGEQIRGIFYSSDDGDTWELEWGGAQPVYDIVYHEVTQSLWAGGRGIILQKNLQTPVAPKDKLTSLWGKLKVGSSTTP